MLNLNNVYWVVLKSCLDYMNVDIVFYRDSKRMFMINDIKFVED